MGTHPQLTESKTMSNPGGVAADQLRAFIERIERLEEEKKGITDDIKDVYAEAKGNGYDVKVMRMVVRLRKQDNNERQEMDAILDLYLHALGMEAGDGAIAEEGSSTPADSAPTNPQAAPKRDFATLCEEAKTVILTEKKASTSLIQRRLEIGYNSAASVIEALEKEGLISAPNFAGKREVLA